MLLLLAVFESIDRVRHLVLCWSIAFGNELVSSTVSSQAALEIQIGRLERKKQNISKANWIYHTLNNLFSRVQKEETLEDDFMADFRITGCFTKRFLTNLNEQEKAMPADHKQENKKIKLTIERIKTWRINFCFLNLSYSVLFNHITVYYQVIAQNRISTKLWFSPIVINPKFDQIRVNKPITTSNLQNLSSKRSNKTKKEM